LGPESRLSEERRGDDSKRHRDFLPVKYIDYQPEFLGAFSSLFADYWREVHGEELETVKVFETEDGDIITNGVEAQIYKYLYEDRAKIKIAVKGERMIGFMVYHYIFDSILICHGIYLRPEFRKANRMISLICSPGNPKRVFSQTYKGEMQPMEIRGEKKNRKLLHERENVLVWENILNRRPRNGS